MKAKTHLSQNKSRGGFTLVEMLVVISMIAALAGISFPVYRSIQKKVEKQSENADTEEKKDGTEGQQQEEVIKKKRRKRWAASAEAPTDAEVNGGTTDGAGQQPPTKRKSRWAREGSAEGGIRNPDAASASAGNKGGISETSGQGDAVFSWDRELTDVRARGSLGPGSSF